MSSRVSAGRTISTLISAASSNPLDPSPCRSADSAPRRSGWRSVIGSCSQLAHDRTTPGGTGWHQTTQDDTWRANPCLAAATLGSGVRKGVEVRILSLAPPLTCASSCRGYRTGWSRRSSCPRLPTRLCEQRPGGEAWGRLVGRLPMASPPDPTRCGCLDRRNRRGKPEGPWLLRALPLEPWQVPQRGIARYAGAAHRQLPPER